MKPEPFKEIRLCEIYCELSGEGFTDKDMKKIEVSTIAGITSRLYKNRIKSAVEWLINEMCELGNNFGYEVKRNKNDNGIPVVPQIVMGKLIDKAFEDVTK